jgi:hypothetical protein
LHAGGDPAREAIVRTQWEEPNMGVSCGDRADAPVGRPVIDDRDERVIDFG